MFKTIIDKIGGKFELNGHLGNLKGSFKIEIANKLDNDNQSNIHSQQIQNIDEREEETQDIPDLVENNNEEEYQLEEYFIEDDNINITEGNNFYQSYKNPEILQIESFNNKLDLNHPVFVMFYAPWCNFSKESLPEFEKLINNYNGKIEIITINCEENKDLAIKHKIQQYPTIRYYPNGMTEPIYNDYNQERTYNKFIEYIKSITDTII